MFQSRTGSPGHLAGHLDRPAVARHVVSIPDGLPRPFSLQFRETQGCNKVWFQSRTGSPGHLAAEVIMGSPASNWVSIPDGLPRPFSLCTKGSAATPPCVVSIPDGLPRPFSPQLRKPNVEYLKLFQSRTGSPGHLAKGTLHLPQ